MTICWLCFVFFFFNDTATTEIYTLSLHDALPIYRRPPVETPTDWSRMTAGPPAAADKMPEADWWRSFHNQELTQFIEQALVQNHDVRRAVSRVLEGRASVTTAGAGLYPQLNVQGSYTNLAISKNTLAGDRKSVV